MQLDYLQISFIPLELVFKPCYDGSTAALTVGLI